ncbi:helix-turn-helix domain-containing protein [Starkeya sp. ORNL1]|uniref:helix-turn-helix domain-containing protein n=1 Tax=Starkeya sp. ORNL1 TaxID=2709380 RepID=UPI001462D59C|nr:helix-turn-helix domain-containing protein [Starkeya sp. ORNL1]QJP14625.1 helix-turn-helix domain-containing protein [Starkeya sp. ORNL1]
MRIIVDVEGRAGALPNDETIEVPVLVFLTVFEAIKVSGIGRTTLFEAMRTGALPARKIGTKNLILVADLEAFIKALPVRVPAANGAR